MKMINLIKKSSGDIFSRKLKLFTVKIIDGFPHNDSGSFIRNPHFWIIATLIAVLTFLYYIDQTPLADTPPINTSLLTGVHDFQRTLFFIPVIYAAMVFRVRGSLIGSFVFVCAVSPRAFLFSPYPDPLLRPLLFVAIATLTSLLIATQLNRVEKERKANAELKTAYKQLEESQQQLIQAEKLASLGQMAACIAHEVNNPLAGILVYTQLLLRKTKSDNIAREETLNYLSKIELETTRSGKLIRNLLEFSRQSTPTFSLVDVNEITNQALELTIHSVRRQHIEVLKELSIPLPDIMADFNQLQQVFTNIILNAVQAMPKGGILTIRTSAGDNGVTIVVEDTGCGISPENIPKLFIPFFTTKREVKGVGLGLAVTHGIIQRHKGKIEVQSKQGEGSIFTVFLPSNNG